MSQDVSEPLRSNPPDKKIGVLLVDDHAVVRQGLRMFILLRFLFGMKRLAKPLYVYNPEIRATIISSTGHE